jgi:ACS family hexuronate transporter-like MFS transporter
MSDANQRGETSSASGRAWWICVLLLLASAINYMDRQTLANASVRITREFELSEEQYGNLEAGFGWAFAAGSLVFGYLADKISVRWLYACVLALWSAVGFATGYSRNYDELLLYRTLLGFFEAGHWPCGVKTVRVLLGARDRALGNSVLQSGTSIGAIVTPIIMAFLLTSEEGSWRFPFQIVGAVGFVWVVAWLALAPRLSTQDRHASEAEVDVATDGARSRSWWQVLLDRRMLVILVVVALINTAWQLLRAWLPKFLQEGRGYSENPMLYFNAVWFAVTDVGCLGAGALTLWLARRGHSIVQSRLVTFGACALLCLSALFLPGLDAGWLLLAVLLIVGAGALGVFPIYHAFTQELSHEYQGRVTGIAGVAAWAFSPLAHQLFGKHIDRTGSFDQGLMMAGCLPMTAFLCLLLFWPRDRS